MIGTGGGEPGTPARDFDDWFAARFTAACRWAASRIGDVDHAEDVGLAVFAIAWEHWTAADDPNPEHGPCEDLDGCIFLWCRDDPSRTAWLRRLVRWRVKDLMRWLRHRQLDLRGDLLAEEVPGRTPDAVAGPPAGPDEIVVHREDAEWFAAHLRELDDEDRELLLAEIEGRTIAELARERGVTVFTLYGERRRLREALRRAWERRRPDIEEQP